MNNQQITARAFAMRHLVREEFVEDLIRSNGIDSISKKDHAFYDSNELEKKIGDECRYKRETMSSKEKSNLKYHNKPSVIAAQYYISTVSVVKAINEHPKCKLTNQKCDENTYIDEYVFWDECGDDILTLATDTWGKNSERVSRIRSCIDAVRNTAQPTNSKNTSMLVSSNGLITIPEFSLKHLTLIAIVRDYIKMYSIKDADGCKKPKYYNEQELENTIGRFCDEWLQTYLAQKTTSRLELIKLFSISPIVMGNSYRIRKQWLVNSLNAHPELDIKIKSMEDRVLMNEIFLWAVCGDKIVSEMSNNWGETYAQTLRLRTRTNAAKVALKTLVEWDKTHPTTNATVNKEMEKTKEIYDTIQKNAGAEQLTLETADIAPQSFENMITAAEFALKNLVLATTTTNWITKANPAKFEFKGSSCNCYNEQELNEKLGETCRKNRLRILKNPVKLRKVLEKSITSISMTTGVSIVDIIALIKKHKEEVHYASSLTSTTYIDCLEFWTACGDEMLALVKKDKTKIGVINTWQEARVHMCIDAAKHASAVLAEWRENSIAVNEKNAPTKATTDAVKQLKKETVEVQQTTSMENAKIGFWDYICEDDYFYDGDEASHSRNNNDEVYDGFVGDYENNTDAVGEKPVIAPSMTYDYYTNSRVIADQSFPLSNRYINGDRALQQSTMTSFFKSGGFKVLSNDEINEFYNQSTGGVTTILKSLAREGYEIKVIVCSPVKNNGYRDVYYFVRHDDEDCSDFSYRVAIGGAAQADVSIINALTSDNANEGIYSNELSVNRLNALKNKTGVTVITNDKKIAKYFNVEAVKRKEIIKSAYEFYTDTYECENALEEAKVLIIKYDGISCLFIENGVDYFTLGRMITVGGCMELRRIIRR